jgi:hypothetical protein
MSPSETGRTATGLEYRVFTAKRPGLGRADVPPGHESLMWVANSATLIFGERDAVLVDRFLTIDHGARLADQVAASGKNLTHIYSTHAHGDPEHDDDPRNIAETPQYLRDFIRLEETTDTPRALFDAMIELYPDRANPGSLWGAAKAAKQG